MCIRDRRFLDCRNQIENSTYCIIWGNNPAITKQGYFQRFENVVENGGKLVVIDPISVSYTHLTLPLSLGPSFSLAECAGLSLSFSMLQPSGKQCSEAMYCAR